MSDPYAQQPGKQAPSPFAVQMMDPKFRDLSYEDQQRERMRLFASKAASSPAWQQAPDDMKIAALKRVKDLYPPAFADTRYENLRQVLESPTGQGKTLRFLYDMDTQMGSTGLLTRGVVNAGRALSGAVDSVGRFFTGGARQTVHPSTYSDLDLRLLQAEGRTPETGQRVNAFEYFQNASPDELMARAIAGDKDGVKLASYLQRKYEHPVNPNIPLIGGQTPTQLLGSALGYGTDLLAMKGVAEAVPGAAGASALAKVGARAAVTGTLGVIRGEVAEAVNAARPGVAPIEGATDTSHGIVETVKSIGLLWGQWAAQDAAFGMLGQGAAEGVARIGKTFGRALLGQGGKALPHAEMFEKTAGGEYTPEAARLQDQFFKGNVDPAARSQLGATAKDWSQNYSEALDYSRENPMALMDNPVAAMKVANTFILSDSQRPLGVSMVSDGPNTWRMRTSLGRGGELLGEHLTLPEAEMVSHGQWSDAIEQERAQTAKWQAAWEEKGGKEDLRQIQSHDMHLNALQDAFPHDRMIRDSLTIIEGNMERLRPEGAAKGLSEGPMLSYGEVGQLRANGMKVARISVDVPREGLSNIEKQGSLFPTDRPTNLQTVSSGDYNGAIVYAKAAPDGVWQASLSWADQALKKGAEGTREDLAFWKLRDGGYDAVEHADGSVTALYPREQIKHVTEFVNKWSREYTAPEELPTVGGASVMSPERPTMYRAPEGLGPQERAEWFMNAVAREGTGNIAKFGTDNYALSMKGYPPFQGSLDEVTDAFLLRSTTPSHLRASLESEGMSLRQEGGQYSILDTDGKVLGSGANVAQAMWEAKYRPKLLDGRFGPRNIEILPEGSRFRYSGDGVSGSLRDVYKLASQFMDVAAEEGRKTVASTGDGKLTADHDGAYTVEIPGWGIRERFASSAEAHEYLNGKYKEYDNAERLANERGFAFTYDPKRGYVLSDATGTYTVHSMDEVGKILAKTPDPRWAPGGQFDAGVTLKNSADVPKLASDVIPLGKYAGRGPLGQAISRAKSVISDWLAPARTSMARAEVEYGIKGLGQAFSKVGEGIKAASNQSYVDAQKAFSIERLYNLSNKDWIAVDKVMQALGEEDRQRTLEDLGYTEGSPKRAQIQDAASRMRTLYNASYTRTGQNPDIMLIDFARKVHDWKQANPQAYQEMELSGPDGMQQLVQRVYGGRVPEDLGFMSQYERVADVDGILKDQNAISKFIAYSHMANRWALAGENFKAFAERLAQPDVPKHVQILGQHYIDEALNGSRSEALDVLKALGKEGEGPQKIILSYLQTAAGMGAYGFKPSSALTILEHNYLLGSGFLGTEAMNRGFKAASDGGLDHLKDLFQKGVFTGKVPMYGFNEAAGGGGTLASLFNRLGKASGYFVQNGHILGRAGVYDAASWLFDKHLRAWFDRGKVGDWTQKAKAIKAFRLDPGALDQVETLLSQGDYEGAKHAYAQNMTDQIAFGFRPEDQGRALNTGILGKMFGQLTVVPMHYMAALTRLAGSGGFFDRTAALATFAKNTAAFYGANRMAGLSGGNLMPWRVVTLRGGPLWQAMVNLSSSQPGKRELQTAMKEVTALAPMGSQVTQAVEVIKQIEAGRPYAAFLTAGGFSVRPDLRAPK